MIILSVECTASPASVCIYDGEKILASSFINVKLTHSQTLLPMIESTLRSTLMTIDDIDGISVASGPGSFTGVRIGISAVKGLAAPKDLPCVGVSSLSAMANLFLDENCYVCPVMDARCDQFYNALFNIKDGKITRLCEDRAIMLDDLKNELEKIESKVIICGDGADKFCNSVPELKNIIIADKSRKFQSAVGVAFASYDKFTKGDTQKCGDLLPAYLRLPQAERELKSKQSEDK